MNKIFGVLGIVIYLTIPVQAETSTINFGKGFVDPVPFATLASGSSLTTVGDTPITSYLLENCDTNEKTVSEVRECKLKYWRFEVRERQKALDETQNKLDHARERVKAFEGDPVAPCFVENGTWYCK